MTSLKNKEFKPSSAKIVNPSVFDGVAGRGQLEKLDANVSIRNLPEAEVIATEYFLWDVSFSVPTSTNVNATMSQTGSNWITLSSSTEILLSAGLYNITSNVTWNVNTTGKREIAVLVNWTVKAWRNRPATVWWVMMGISHTFYASEWDKVSLRMYQDSGSTVSSTSLNTVWIYKL